MAGMLAQADAGSGDAGCRAGAGRPHMLGLVAGITASKRKLHTWKRLSWLLMRARKYMVGVRRLDRCVP